MGVGVLSARGFVFQHFGRFWYACSPLVLAGTKGKTYDSRHPTSRTLALEFLRSLAMHVYLPIAAVSQNLFILLGLGGMIGFLSGLFGVGGGFMLTPLLIFLGIPPIVAVASGANQVLGSSVSGLTSHWRRRAVDVKMGIVLILGGLLGSGLGMWLFEILRKLGQIDLTINLCYVALLGTLGTLMFVESSLTLYRRTRGVAVRRKLHRHSWIHRLPLKMRFPRSRLYISALAPFAVGTVTGILSAIMGVGGGFIMVPAMIYLLEMPTMVVVGTSLLQIVFVTANVTVLQAVNNYSVDIVLVMIMITGGVVGASAGARVGRLLKADQMRFLLALLVLGMGINMAVNLMAQPDEIYQLGAAIQ